MATYKKPCIHCGYLLDTAMEICSNCASQSPFGYSCPGCKHTVQLSDAVCSDCGRALYIGCPHCGQRTFVQNICQWCAGPLTVRCANKKCGADQFYLNTRCTACGKAIKATAPAPPKER